MRKEDRRKVAFQTYGIWKQFSGPTGSLAEGYREGGICVISDVREK
jgi:hypothetical protein